MRKILMFCCLALAFPAWASHDDDDQGEGEDLLVMPIEERSARVPYTAGSPVIDRYGRPRQFVPAQGGGAALGPITPNAYGPGVGMDATGRPVKVAPWP